MELFCEVRFEAAHRLPNVAPDHKCARLHGHSYCVEIRIDGPVDESSGMVVDFAEVKSAFAPLRAQLDHHYLNEIEGLENPTSENLARWIWARLAPSTPYLSAIVVHETSTSGCRYSGD